MDAGISVKKDSHRPDLERLMKDAEAHRFGVAMVEKVDCFYRHLRGLLGALDQLNNWNIAFVSVQERLDFTTARGKVGLTVLGILAQIYQSNHGTNTRSLDAAANLSPKQPVSSRDVDFGSVRHALVRMMNTQ